MSLVLQLLKFLKNNRQLILVRQWFKKLANGFSWFTIGSITIIIFYSLIFVSIVASLFSIDALPIAFGVFFLSIYLAFPKVIRSIVARIIKSFYGNLKKDWKFTLLGLTLLSIQLTEYIPFIIGSPLDKQYTLLWYSNIVPVVLSLAFIFRSKAYMTVILVSSLLLETPWIIDFLGRGYFDHAPFGGLADYMYPLKRGFVHYISLNHLFYMPLSAYGVLKLGIHKKAYFLYGPWSLALNGLAFFLSPAEENVNCVRHLCSLQKNFIDVHPLIYLVLWAIVPVIVLIIPVHLLLVYLYEKSIQKRGIA